MKIKIFSDYETSRLEESVNDFINRHGLIQEIKFGTSLKDSDELVPGNDGKLFFSVMIVYNE